MLRLYKETLLSLTKDSFKDNDRIATRRTVTALKSFQYEAIDSNSEHIVLTGPVHVFDLLDGKVRNKKISIFLLKEWCEARGIPEDRSFSIKRNLIERGNHKTPATPDLLYFPTLIFATREIPNMKKDVLNHIVKNIKWKY
jgi:hypothetical protein